MQLRIGHWVVTPALNLLERGDRSARLEPRTMNVLVHLAEHAGEVVSVDALVRAVWHGVVVGDGSVYLVISKLRQALDDDDTKHIETIPKRGYRLTAHVTWTEPDLRARGLCAGDGSVENLTRSQYPVAQRAAAVIGLIVATLLAGWWLSGTLSRVGGNGPLATSSSFADAAVAGEIQQSEAVELSSLFFRIYLSRSLEEGLALVDHVTARYPNAVDAQAHGAKAFLYAQSLTKTYHGNSVEAASRARTEELVAEHAAVALEKEPNSAIAHIALGTRDFYNWRWSAALESFRRAEAMATERTPAFAHGIWLRSYLGEHDEAIALAEEMIRANADNPARTLRVLASANAYAGHHDRALANLRLSLAGATGNDVTAQLLVSLEIANDDESAARANLVSLDQPVRGYLAALLDEDAAGSEGLEALRAREAAGESVGAGDWAIAHLAAGDSDGAISWLERAAEKARNHEADESFYNLMFLKMNIAGDPVLEQPQFAEVLERVRGR